jgi:hypothetical protein
MFPAELMRPNLAAPNVEPGLPYAAISHSAPAYFEEWP